jgi:transposase
MRPIGASHAIGTALLRRQHRLFRWWHRVRDGTLSREQFMAQVTHLRQGFQATLAEAAALPIESDEKSPLAKTVRTCRRLLKVEPALWTFVSTVGVEPTNNAAERALRPAVIWRKTSFWCPVKKWQSVCGQIAYSHHFAQGAGQKYSRFSHSRLFGSTDGK